MQTKAIPSVMHAPGHKLEPIVGGTREWKIEENFEFEPIDRFNAADNQWFENELVHYLPDVLTRKLPEITARILLPVYFANDPGATSFEYKQVDSFGEAEFVDDWATDPPGTSLKGEKVRSMVQPIRMAAGPWSIDDLARWAKTGRRLDTSHMDGARDGCLRKENKAAWGGDSSRLLHGVLSTEAAIPVDSAAGVFSGRTNVQLLGDLHTWSSSIRQNTEDVETGGALMILPHKQYDRAATLYLGTNSDSDSVLKKFLANDGYVTTVVRSHDLKGAGAAGVDVGIILTRDPRAIQLIVISDLEVLAAERRNQVTWIPMVLRTAGVAVKYPKAHRILSNI